MESLIKFVQDEFVTKKSFPNFLQETPLRFITKFAKVKNQNTVFRGVVIQVKGTGSSKTFTIRKMSGTVGVERIFPINLPALQKIEVNKRGSVRRKRIYYFRELTGKKARIKENKF